MDDVETSSSKPVPFSLNDLSPLDLHEYLCWGCPLQDENLLASIARIIISFVGTDIILSFLSRINNPETYKLNAGCVSNDGICYIHHRCVEGWSDNHENFKVAEYGLSRVPLYFSKIYGQPLILRKRYKNNKIRGINVLSSNINYKDNKNNDGNNNDKSNIIEQSNEKTWLKVMKRGMKAKYIAEIKKQEKKGKSKSPFKSISQSVTDPSKVDWKNNDIESNLCHWHDMVMTQSEYKDDYSIKRVNRTFKIEKSTFIFYHDYFTLYCYNSGYFNDNKSKNKCVIVDENSSLLANNDMKIVDFWRCNDRLYMLRGSIENAPVSDVIRKFHDPQIIIQNFSKKNESKDESKDKSKDDENENKAENKSNDNNNNNNNEMNGEVVYDPAKHYVKPDIGDCQLYQIKLNNQAIVGLNSTNRKNKKPTVDSINDWKTNDKSNENENENRNENKQESSSIRDETQSESKNETCDLNEATYSKTDTDVVDCDIIICKKIFSLSSQYITQHCSYFDEISQTLVVAYNTKIQTVELKLFQASSDSNIGDINIGNNGNNGGTLTSASTLSTDGKILEWPKEIAPLFYHGRSYCEHLFYHSFSNSLILLVRLPYNFDSKLYSYETKDWNSMPDTIRNMYKNHHKKYSNIQYDPNSKLAGIVLIQFSLNFNKLCFDKMKYAVMKQSVSNDLTSKYKIVCYDDTRGCLIVDTGIINSLTYGYISDIDVYKERMKIFNQQGFKPLIEYDEKINKSSGSSKYGPQYWRFKPKRRETNFKVLRINDLVAKWKTIS